ncbi:uncharacterized protein LOC135499135 [Lineus longissimus]|uniref:uncharacterized protein LOC135499135 n=1 Tax=Lineus longissimus TaxID=88925 RepID=UPI00315D22D8
MGSSSSSSLKTQGVAALSSTNSTKQIINTDINNSSKPSKNIDKNKPLPAEETVVNPWPIQGKENSKIVEKRKNVETQTKSDTLKENSAPVRTQGDAEQSSKENEMKASKVSVKSASKVDVVARKKAEEKMVVTASMKEQADFNIALRLMCPLMAPDEIMKYSKLGVLRVQLLRALPPGGDLFKLLRGLRNLQELDVSHNDLGPQGFRALMLAMADNGTIKSLNVANNQTDVDSAKSIGIMLSSNRCLIDLDLSSNYLGKDFLSRSIGPALKVNKTLGSLKVESCGSTDLTVFLDGLLENSILTDLNLNHNEMGDKAHLGIGLAKCLKKPDCALQCLRLQNCGINAAGMKAIEGALRSNTSLHVINLAGNELSTQSSLMELLGTCLIHSNLEMLTLDDCRILDKGTVKSDSFSTFDAPSKMKLLSLSSLSLSDDAMGTFFKVTGAKLDQLENLNLSNNSVSVATLKTFQDVTTREDGSSSLESLHLCLNDVSYLPEFLSASNLHNLRVLNLRRARVKPTTVQDLAPSIQKLGISALILNGLKLSRTTALTEILGNGPNNPLELLSISSCALVDNDIKQIASAIKDGCQLQMLDASANRITDKGVADIVGALISMETHPLQLLDLSSNQITSSGAECLSGLFLEKKHSSCVHSLKLANNDIGSAGLVTLMKAVHPSSSLLCLSVNSQNANYDEDEMSEIYTSLALSLGFVFDANSEPRMHSSKLPPLYHGLVINLWNLGGDPGLLGKQLDSVAIATDYKQKHIPNLTLSDVLKISSVLKGSDEPDCLMSSEHWNMIIGADKEAPSWLQVDSLRDVAVYMTNLPPAVTQLKLEGFLEAEVDCSVKEVCLMKDPVLHQNNGSAWVLMMDAASVEKAVDFYESGLAQIIGQPFNMCRVQVKVDDCANTQAVAKAKAEVEQRLKKQEADEASHRQLIGRLYHESQARHEYRLKHPAYTDGRIW